MTTLIYERPEVVEIGDAEKMTLGCIGEDQDKCECAKCLVEGCPEVEAAS